MAETAKTKDYHNSLLFQKIHGYIAAGSVGNSMGELMEGFTDTTKNVIKFREILGMGGLPAGGH